MYCEKEKECPIYQIHRELNGHYQRLINELLGKGYYNMGMDATVVMQNLVRICYMRSGE